LVLKIKNLVHAEGYTLSGARQVLEQAHSRNSSRPQSTRDPNSRLPLPAVTNSPPPSAQPPENLAATVAHARAELREIAGLLATPDPQPPRRRPRVTVMPPKSDTLFPL
jgi:hypothetical protein